MNKELAAKLNLPALEKGWVWLVGAGPGDPGLITAVEPGPGTLAL